MSTLIDFSPIKTGGGAQLALNFINYISENNVFSDLVLLVSDRFPFLDDVQAKFECIVSPSSYPKRLYFESFSLSPILKKRGVVKIYTFFGPGLPSFKGIRQVVSVAYPIICNDDSAYWKYSPLVVTLKKRAINFFRKKRLQCADALIFETEIMRNRCLGVLSFSVNDTFVIPPTPTCFLKASTRRFMEDGVLKILILSGLDQHKNLWRLIEIVKRCQAGRFKFIVSASRGDFLEAYKKFIDDDFLERSSDYFDFVGAIPSSEIQDVYDLADIVMNISDLESFSNNYMEAWLAGKPIVASERDFARHICGDSAVYVEPHDVGSIISVLNSFCDGGIDISALKAAGKKKLLELPSLEGRIDLIKVVLQ